MSLKPLKPLKPFKPFKLFKSVGLFKTKHSYSGK